MKWLGIEVRGKLFDVMVAHSLVEPDQRHGLDYLSEVYLGYALTRGETTGREEQLSLGEVASEKVAERAVESADVAWQLRAVLEPLLESKQQKRVFYEIESPLVPVLADMEFEGIKVDSTALADFAAMLSKEMNVLEKTVHQLAGQVAGTSVPLPGAQCSPLPGGHGP